MDNLIDNLVNDNIKKSIILTENQKSGLLRFYNTWVNERKSIPSIKRTAKSVFFLNPSEEQQKVVKEFFKSRNIELKENFIKNETEEIILSEEQKAKILKIWNDSPTPPNLKTLCAEAWGEEIDARDRRAHVVREYLASLDLKPLGSQPIKKEPVILTEEQKLYIYNHAATMNSLEMAKELFNNKDLKPRSIETISVMEHCKSLPSSITQFEEPNEIAGDKNYAPPGTPGKAVVKIKKYIQNSGFDGDYNKFTAVQKKNLQSLISYLHHFRFNVQINNYSKVSDRELFESAFIEFTYNKSDLTAEELDQYILLSVEKVIASDIQRNIQSLQELLDRETEEEDPKIRMGLVEAIKNARAEYNSSVKRQTDLIKDLTGKRSERLKGKISENASLINLIQFMQDEEKRKQLVEFAELRRKRLKEEVKRIETMSDLKMQVFGLDPNEIVNS